MAERSVVIVGGGIAGLSTGCYARMNGYRATVLEMHKIPGGLCTAWSRKGYTWDISMHMLVGSRSGPFHQMWRELGAVQGRRFHYHDEMLRIEGRDKTFSFRPDADDVERQMLAISPGDEKLIRQFVRLGAGPSLMGAAQLLPSELQSPVDKARAMAAVLPLAPALLRHGHRTIQDFAEEFRDPFLRRVVRCSIDTPGWPMLRFPLIGLAGYLRRSGTEFGVPIGGSRAVIDDIADRLRGLGGELRCKARVEEVLVESDRAAGVRLEGGEELRADTVIWAADGHHLIFDLLGGRYMDGTVRAMYDTWTPVRSLVHVALGVARDMSAEPARVMFELDEPITICGERRAWILVNHRSFDPSMAPAGKSSVEVWYPTSYEHWEELAGRPEDYAEEKERIAEMTIAALDRRWPGLAADVEVVDVPTPATYVRYTGNWKGSPDGWYVTPDNSRAEPLRTLPGLSDLMMVGQWTAPFAGTPISALTGRQAIQLLCHRDGVPFRASEPT